VQPHIVRPHKGNWAALRPFSRTSTLPDLANARLFRYYRLDRNREGIRLYGSPKPAWGTIANHFEPIRLAAGEGFGRCWARSAASCGALDARPPVRHHIFLTIRLRFIQRYIGRGIRLSLQRTAEGEGDVSHFGALTTASPQPSARETSSAWQPPSSPAGPEPYSGCGLPACSASPQNTLRPPLREIQGRNRRRPFCRRPMYVLDRGLHCKWLGVLFAAFTAVAAFGIGNMVQANAISRMLAESRWEINPWFSGIVMMVLTAFVILGGIKSIARVCEILVPYMAITYIVGCLVLLAYGCQRSRQP